MKKKIEGNMFSKLIQLTMYSHKKNIVYVLYEKQQYTKKKGLTRQKFVSDVCFVLCSQSDWFCGLT